MVETRTPALVVRTLLTGGFMLDGVHRNPGYAVVRAHRVDEFGASTQYTFAVAEDQLNEAQVAAVQIEADHSRSRLVVVGRCEAEVPSIEWDRFLNLFGGPVFSALPLEPQFPDHLRTLGRNQLPEGLVGRPDDLFEQYVRVALEFVLGTRVIRYGQDRLFERRPDGVMLPFNRFSGLYDAKAYTAGYPVTADSLRQFKSYIDDFSRRYGSYLPRLNSFVAVSAEFVQGEEALTERSRELQADTGVPLACLTADVLIEIVTLVARQPAARQSVDWRRVFGDPVVKSERVSAELEAVQRDGVVRGDA